MMKKISKYYLSAVAAFSLFVGTALADNPGGAAAAIQQNTASGSDLCNLLNKFGGVINTLRVLAFVGAAFVMMEWAWGFIQKGEVKKDDLKDKGTGMLVGFVLLFGVGILLGLLSSVSVKQKLGCVVDLFS
ncbi:MAG: hypothetical protein K6B71_04055 [Alphaproteobacteria bacterium]|nr:hypothetical protein [Alphaproteobacteria bacterium]